MLGSLSGGGYVGRFGRSITKTNPRKWKLSMKCEKCKKETYCVYITEEYQKICGPCCDKKEQKKRKSKNK
jgi:hypothetical protein